MAAGFAIAFDRMVKQHDLGLVGAAGLTVVGAIFAAFSLVAYTFKLDGDWGFITAMFSIAAWLSAAAVWYFFLADPQPRHGKGR